MSKTSIMNMALDLLEEEPILTPEDDRAAVRWMNRNFTPVRDGMLRLHPWNFAIKRADLPRLLEAPLSGWAYQFALPADCLRLFPLTGGFLNGPNISYSVEGRRILTDNPTTPLPIAYIGQVEDDTQMDALFVQAFAATLAARAASWITGKQSMASGLAEQAARMLLQAQQVDSLEGSPPEPLGDDWVTGRTTGVYY